jgi:hypothetical protein
LTRDEITDARLRPLWERADADHDGNVTKAELTALYEKESGPGRDDPQDEGFGGPGGPGGLGGPRGGGFGPPGFWGPPQPGQILPPMLQDRLGLSDKQKEELAALQKEVDAKLAKILTADQKRDLDELRNRGPGGRGGPNGPGRGRGERGGPPPQRQ